MLYKELEALIDSGDKKAGDEFWVVDIRHDDILNKPIRNVSPTKVVLFSNTELPARKKVYYADYHFRTIGKNGFPLATVIAPYDNTGYRGYTGVSLNIFLTEKEAKDCYIAQCETIITTAKEAAASWAARFDGIVENMNRKISHNR